MSEKSAITAMIDKLRNQVEDAGVVDKFLDMTRSSHPPKKLSINESPTSAASILNYEQLVSDTHKYVQAPDSEIRSRARIIIEFSTEDIQRMSREIPSPNNLMRFNLYRVSKNHPPATMMQYSISIAICRAAVQQLAAKVGVMQWSTDKLTPFMAWQMREGLTNVINSWTELVIDKATFSGSDRIRNIELMNCMDHYLPTAEIVMWKEEIWQSAVMGAEHFLGTEISEEIIDSLIPMFWVWDANELKLTGAFYENRNPLSLDVECSLQSFTLMPFTRKMVEVSMPTGAIEKFDVLRPHLPLNNPLGSEEYIKMHLPKDQLDEHYDPDKTLIGNVPGISEFIQIRSTPEVKKALNNPKHITKRGVVICLNYVPKGAVNLPDGIPRLRFMRELCSGDPITGSLQAEIMAALHFLSLKFVHKDDVQISKKEVKQRRDIQKALRKGKLTEPMIKVVSLRRPEKKINEKEQPNEPKHWQYNVHFMVFTGWRSQWYPSIKKHKAKYIEPYLKGNMAGAYKPPQHRVNEANR